VPGPQAATLDGSPGPFARDQARQSPGAPLEPLRPGHQDPQVPARDKAAGLRSSVTGRNLSSPCFAATPPRRPLGCCVAPRRQFAPPACAIASTIPSTRGSASPRRRTSSAQAAKGSNVLACQINTTNAGGNSPKFFSTTLPVRGHWVAGSRRRIAISNVDTAGGVGRRVGASGGLYFGGGPNRSMVPW
jgi:hypothetical protein